jgi:DNA-directed RNA polymerase subunit RPC12/RpoP
LALVTHPLPEDGEAQEVLCPHCSKPFEGELLSGEAERYQGFKCPHCRLFIAHDRADEPDVA